MKIEKREVIEPQNWVPWIGLALVVPALLIMLVFFFGAFFGLQRAPSGKMFFSSDVGSVHFMAGLAATIGAVGGLMLAAVGIVRGLRRSTPHTGRSVGLAGFSLEIAVLVIGIAALIILALAVL